MKTKNILFVLTSSLLVMGLFGCMGSKVFVNSKELIGDQPYGTSGSEVDGYTKILEFPVMLHGGKVIIVAKFTNEGTNQNAQYENNVRLYRKETSELLDESRTWKPVTNGDIHETTQLMYSGIFPAGTSTFVLMAKSGSGNRKAESKLTKIIVEEVNE